jgi:hypothetical protein
MYKFYTVLLLLLSIELYAQKSDISISALVECTFMPQEGFGKYVSNKGFINVAAVSKNALVYERSQRNKSLKHILERQDLADTVSVMLQTTSHAEFTSWRQELQKSGFSYYKDKDKQEEDLYPIFQRRNIIARLSLQYTDIQTLYCLKLENVRLPDVSSIRYAEDLLQLNAHEYIVAVFGAANVKQDVFYFSEQEINQCSILFPNTSNQVIFIWKDEVNKRGISFLLLGGQTNIQGTAPIYSGNLFHKWRSQQGIYLGMTLKELEQLNKASIDFYGWESEQPGHVKNRMNGTIDFTKIGLQLQCLDCSPELTNTDIILSSKNILRTNNRVFVSSMIILPERKAVR